jgi:hypothetical protein
LLWHLTRDLGSQAFIYNDSWILELRGKIDPARLDRALGRLVAKHASLRLNFSVDGIRLMQVCDQRPFRLEVVRVQEGESLRAANNAALQPYHKIYILGSDQLFEAKLFVERGEG